MRVIHHKCILTHNGEKSREESAWTATCRCGRFEESHSTKEGARGEYRHHLGAVKREQEAARVAKANGKPVVEVAADIERDVWLQRTAVAIVNALPSLREFLRDDIDPAVAAAEIVAEIRSSISADEDEKMELAARAMFELKTRVT